MNRYSIGPREVLVEACRIAHERNGSPPTHQDIARNLGCSRQHVSNMFIALDYAGAIKWYSRHSYAIIDSEWTPPPDIEF